MSGAFGRLMERNLIEIFGQRDSARRAVAIAEVYTEDCTFFEAEERIVGRDALNAKIGRILQDAPGFVFRAAGPAQVNHDLGRLQWRQERLRSSPAWTSRSSRTGRFERSIPFSTSLRAIDRLGRRHQLDANFGFERTVQNCPKGVHRRARFNAFFSPH
jgi:hypothetical protein